MTEKRTLICYLAERESEEEIEYALAELGELIGNVDMIAAGTVVQRRSPDINYLFGPGKVKEVKELAATSGVEAVVFNQELSPRQVKSLEQALANLEVWDRTQVILEIFRRRARSREGKIQVELARLTYLYPRMLGLGGTLSRLGGGIGTRGPGETKLEEMRRAVRNQIKKLRDEQAEISRNRGLIRKQRQRSGVSVAALVGYTNAGKSTLLNALAASVREVLAEDRLFVTLDPISRKVVLPSGRECLVTDTVGLVRDMPFRVREAFKATLEELAEADLLLHVIDLSSPYREEQEETVEDLIREMELDDKPLLRVYSKLDRWTGGIPGDGIAVSAPLGWHLTELLTQMEVILYGERETILDIPFERLGSFNRWRRRFEVVREDYTEKGVSVTLKGKPQDIDHLLAQLQRE